MDDHRLARFLAKICVNENGCWEWTASLMHNGYGQFSIDRQGRLVAAHRAAYEHWVSSIPVGLQLDHLCRNRKCVNPDHLEPVTQRENMLRGIGPAALAARATHCKRGHPFSPENTLRLRTRNERVCRTCKHIRAASLRRLGS